MSLLVTDQGGVLFARSPRALTDRFPDVGPLGSPWVDGHDYDDTAYEPLGVTAQGVVVSDPMARVGAEYAPNQNVAPGDLDGKQYLGVGCAWRETGFTTARVGVRTRGVSGLTAAPLCHVTPGSTEHGIGSWWGFLGGQWLASIEAIGNPPEALTTYDFGVFTPPPGGPTWVEMRSDGTGVTVWIDGAQVQMLGSGFAPYPIPAPLLGSTLHGFALDTHFHTPVESIPTEWCFDEWRCTYP